MTALPNHILKALRTNKTSLGEHPSFPPEEEEKFLVNLVSDTFEELSENVDVEDVDMLKKELGRILGECKKIEKNNKEALESLCADIINDIFKIPEDTLKITANIVDKVDMSSERLIPEKTTDFSFDDIEDMNNLSDEIYKRRMLNALSTGAAMYYMGKLTEYVQKIFEVNPDLPSLYKKAIEYNNILMFYEKDTLDEEKNSNGGKVDVTISSSDEYPSIEAEAILFPILFEETAKGIFELAISHGLPKKIDKAKYVMSKSDFKLAELWDMRLGLSLWTLIENEVANCDYDMVEIGPHFLLMEISEMECNEFNKTLQEIFARTKKGKKILSEILDKISYDKEKDDFDNYIQNRNDSEIQLNDNDCFTPEELMNGCDGEDSFISSELITDDLDYEVNEDVTKRQMRNAVNRRMSNVNSVGIQNNSEGNLTTVKMNRHRGYKSSLSRLVIKAFNNGMFEKVQIINGTQDYLVYLYKEMVKKYEHLNYVIFKTKTDTVINKPCVIMFSKNVPMILCMFIETDDLITQNSYFDLNNVKSYIEKMQYKLDLPDISFYKFPDESPEKIRVRRPRMNQRSNWGWIENGKPRPYNDPKDMAESVKKN